MAFIHSGWIILAVIIAIKDICLAALLLRYPLGK